MDQENHILTGQHCAQPRLPGRHARHGLFLKIYRTDCLRQIKMFQGMHRFLPALFKIEGFKVKELPVNHRERTKGKTKYNFWNRSFNTVADMLAVRWMRQRKLKYEIKHD